MPEFGTTPTLQQYQSIQKKKAAQINLLNTSIRSKREELKNLSDSISKYLQKKTNSSNHLLVQQTRPKFNLQFTNPHLKQLHQTKQQLHSKINDCKQKINEYLREEEPEVVNEILTKQSIMEKLKRDETKILEEKRLLQNKMANNKSILENYKNSQCLKQIAHSQQQLQKIRKKMKEFDKTNNEFLNYEVQLNLYTFEVTKYLQKSTKQVNSDDVAVNQKVIHKHIDEINMILEEKQKIQKAQQKQFMGLEKHLKYFTKNNQELERELRKLTSEQMQKTLDQKKSKIKNNQSATNLRKLPEIDQRKKQEKKQPIQPWDEEQNQKGKQSQFIQQDLQRFFQDNRPLSSNKTLIIGKWNQQNYIKDDIVEAKNISRAIGLKIRTKAKKIVGIGATYINRIGVEVIGRGNIWKTDKNTKDEDEEDFQIDLEDVEWMKYTNTADSSIGLKWELKNGSSVTVGILEKEQQIQSILLNDHWIIKSAQFCLDQTFAHIGGIKLKLSKYQGHNPEELQKNASVRRWKSISEVALTKKKVIVKGNSHSKKFSDVAKIDHRLLLNRKKKIV